jgi:cell division protein FtsI (penicillin-binding protein 3)
MIDEPAGAHYGGQVAAPVFAAITASALRTLQVTPDAPLDSGREMIASRSAP